MLGWARPLTKLLMKDYYLDRRSAARFSKIIKNLDQLEKIESGIETNANRDNPNVRKVEKLVVEHKENITKIMDVFKQVVSNENLSYENDIKEPRDAIRGFVGVLEQHSKSFVDPTLNKKVKGSIKMLNDHFEEFEKHLEQEMSAVTEVFSREIMGLTSQYAMSVGNAHDLAEIIGASEARKQEIDHHVEEIVKEVKKIKENITNYLGDKKEKTSIDLNQIFKKKAVVGVWYRIGDKEFRQRLYKYKTYQIHRWVVRDAGKNGSGVFANKAVITSSGIFHHELLNLLDSFDKIFVDLIENVWSRSQVTRHNLANIGFLSYKINNRIVDLEKKVMIWLDGDKKAVAKIIVIERSEEKEVKSALEEFVTYGTRTLAYASAAKKNVAVNSRRVTAALLIAGFALNPVSHHAGAIPSANSHGINTPAMVAQVTDAGEKARVVAVPVEIVVRDVVESNIIERIGMNIVEVAQFPKGVSDEVINQAQDIDHFTPNVLAAIQHAARDAGYTNYVDFVKASDLTINFKMTGHGSIEGKGSYNLKLSNQRANHVKDQLQKLSDHGIKVNFEMVEGKGEQSEAKFIKSIKDLLTKKNTGDMIVNNLLDKLNPRSKRALKYWWETYNKTKRPKVKKKALANLEWTVSRVAELDALLLAPERKVEVLAELQYNRIITEKKEVTSGMCITKLITVDDSGPVIVPLDIQPEKRGFVDKAILQNDFGLSSPIKGRKTKVNRPSVRGTTIRTAGRKRMGHTWGHRVSG